MGASCKVLGMQRHLHAAIDMQSRVRSSTQALMHSSEAVQVGAHLSRAKTEKRLLC
jgi:hypothetical protein